MGADLAIYRIKGSPFVRKVQVLLAEKSIEYELEGVNIFPAPDSSAICAYLERKHPEPARYPKEAFAYGRALWLEECADSELASLVGLGMFRPLSDYLDREIGDHEFLVGDAISIADIAVATQFVNLRFAGGSVDAARWPKLAAYVERMQARTSFAARIEDESRLFPPGGYEL
jgi:glutathione S-transferase